MAASKPVRKRLAGLVRKHAKKFFSLESACVQGDDAEVIHDMRVASRRLQEALCLASRMAGVKLPKALIGPIRRARDVLGNVRDMDVITQRLREVFPDGPRAGSARNREVLKLLSARRGKRLKKMRRRLVKLRLGLFLSEFEGSLKTKLWAAWDRRTSARPDPDDAEAAACFQAALDERAARWQAASQAAAEEQQDAELHQARIAAKRLRYLLELGDACQIGRFRTRIRQLKSRQRSLGQWHDLLILEDHLLDLVADRDVLGRDLDVCRHILNLVASLRSNRAKLVRRFIRQSARARAAGRPHSPDVASSAPAPDPAPTPPRAATIDFVPADPPVLADAPPAEPPTVPSGAPNESSGA